MSGFIEGEDRNQATLFPERIDDYTTEDSPEPGPVISSPGPGSQP